ncbi:uncharacterized protein BDZ99DRAFT_194692 [Mytilinidion resinicola]|uniref:Uncharacterized protein n=1 Tax=Mytilinidion resinicola TaxID=574789 RepID=A0A6A6Z5A4_9PEZI|nr:uncharacterized protein BDZ99DRAFT_194692 [Mytilinidion resinicola]KAF2815365.1 hypothetical protein BDZ99DRAFT_194692 [Mytilinidion resinicola]
MSTNNTIFAGSKPKPEEKKSEEYKPALASYKPILYKIKLRAALDSSDAPHLDPSSSIWKDLHSLVDQDVLNDAYALTLQVKDLIHSADPDLVLETRREPKVFGRFQVKASYGGYDKHGNASFSKFKAVSDFISFRIPTGVPWMLSNIQRLVAAITKLDGKYYIKPDKNGGQVEILDRHVVRETMPKDLCCFVYAYLPGIGHVIEFQVNHPFASFAFGRDSYLRDHPEENAKLVDLWREKFYPTMRDILMKEVQPTEEEKDLIKAKFLKLYKGKQSDPDLIDILEGEGFLAQMA